MDTITHIPYNTSKICSRKWKYAWLQSSWKFELSPIPKSFCLNKIIWRLFFFLQPWFFFKMLENDTISVITVFFKIISELKSALACKDVGSCLACCTSVWHISAIQSVISYSPYVCSVGFTSQIFALFFFRFELLLLFTAAIDRGSICHFASLN